MKFRILPSSLTDPYHYQPLTSYLLNSSVAVDAGALGIGLSISEQRRVTDIIVTHAHLDHIATLPTFLDNMFSHARQPIRVHGTEYTISVLQQHIFNDHVWPDFSRLHNQYGPVMQYCHLPLEQQVQVGDLGIMAVEVNHPVPTTGVIVEAARGGWVITSDTYHTEKLWHWANRLPSLRAVFADVSFPNRLDRLAEVSGHLTPLALAQEITKLDRPTEVFAVHLKTNHQSEILTEVAALSLPRVRVARIGRDYIWD